MDESTNWRRPLARLAIALAVAWLGLYVHNVADLPGMTPLSPEHSVAFVLSIALWLAWWRTSSGATRAVILGYGLFQLIGGSLSVLPLAFLPFYPAQTTDHYGFHVLFALAQLPLIGAAAGLHRRGREGIESWPATTATPPRVNGREGRIHRTSRGGVSNRSDSQAAAAASDSSLTWCAIGYSR